jgi:hypothetical protein
MKTFNKLWNAPVGRANLCDDPPFGTRCAMRMGEALRGAGHALAGLKTCVTYDRKRFASRAPGHVRSAQELANHFHRKPKKLGAKSFKIHTGTMQGNM